jgi:hypothetical protein
MGEVNQDSWFSVTGSIVLGPGSQEIEIPSPYPNPASVYLNVIEDETTTCIGDLTWVSSQMLTNSFMLYVDIKSNGCTIYYVMMFSPLHVVSREMSAQFGQADAQYGQIEFGVDDQIGLCLKSK